MSRSEGISASQGQAKVRSSNGPQRAAKGTSGTLQSVILKKCDRTYHRPESNKACAGGTCQHTCEPAEIASCRHKWTLRYSVNGRQREQSFADEIDDKAGRPRPGSGLRKARDAQLHLTTEKRRQGQTFTDPKAGNVRFGDAVEKFITTGMPKAGKPAQATARGSYHSARPLLDDRTVAQVAVMRDEVTELLNVTMLGKNANTRRQCRRVITGTLDAAVRAGIIPRHLLAGIELTKRPVTEEEYEAEAAGFVFLSDAQVAAIADGVTTETVTKTGKTRRHTVKGMGMAAWLQRTMGLRIGEALGAEKADFKVRPDGRRYLRLRWQASDDGRARVPLKHRQAGQGRDIPVPDWVWDKVQAMPDGSLCPGPSTRYLAYNTAWDRFTKLTAALGIEGVTSHSLRHQYASETLETVGIHHIASLSETLGHSSPEITLRTYVHASANSAAQIADAMNARWGKPALQAAA